MLAPSLADRVSGPGSSFVMAAFTHRPPAGSRFSDGSFGVFYAARERETAIAETVHHRERFLREMAPPPTQLDMRVLRCGVRGELHDLRGLVAKWPGVYDPDGYGESQRLGVELRAAGSCGVVFRSGRAGNARGSSARGRSPDAGRRSTSAISRMESGWWWCTRSGC